MTSNASDRTQQEGKGTGCGKLQCLTMTMMQWPKSKRQRTEKQAPALSACSLVHMHSMGAYVVCTQARDAAGRHSTPEQVARLQGPVVEEGEGALQHLPEEVGAKVHILRAAHEDMEEHAYITAHAKARTL